MSRAVGRSQARHLHAQLYEWHDGIQRNLPWKESKDPYRTWVSEIILQQTRVAQGTPYYLRFIEAFPDIRALADADIDTVLLLWQGLGYYSRARNMHATARYIRDELDGIFPSSYDDILSLKGIGEYTAAAIASFSYDLPYAVVDGNVKRVVARLFGIDTPINSSAGHKEIKQATNQIFDESQPAVYNQAIMDLGAMTCLPRLPDCASCPWQHYCIAYAHDLTTILPVKKKSNPKRHRYFVYTWYVHGKKVAIRKRGTDGLWKGLYELPYDELDSQEQMAHFRANINTNFIISEKTMVQNIKHILSHQIIHASVLQVELNALPKNDWLWVEIAALKKYAMPRLLTQALQEILH